MKTIIKVLKWLLNLIKSLLKKTKKNDETKPTIKYAIAYVSYVCKKILKGNIMANTGFQLFYKWSYKQDGQVISTCQLIKQINSGTPVFYTEAEVAALTNSEYEAAFVTTVYYMQNVLGWTMLPALSNSKLQNLTACPVGSGGGGSTGDINITVELFIDITQIASLATDETVSVSLLAIGNNWRTAGVSSLSSTNPTGTAFSYGFEMLSTGTLSIKVDSTIGNMFEVRDKNENQLSSYAPTGQATVINNVANLVNLIENNTLKLHVIVTV
ncbi:MAG: hypothetical protein LBT56_02930 [Prevotellaceae bacterium]|jgi:hypothetical protein|nr:hypothetical protein [Prevotellaceae bacterium]